MVANGNRNVHTIIFQTECLEFHRFDVKMVENVSKGAFHENMLRFMKKEIIYVTRQEKTIAIFLLRSRKRNGKKKESILGPMSVAYNRANAR